MWAAASDLDLLLLLSSGAPAGSPSQEEEDRLLALRLLADEDGDAGSQQEEQPSNSLIDPTWELVDPTPNIHSLFLEFNGRFFGGGLASVEVKWSKRMTLCAGLCCYEGRGGLCCIKLSEPLLKLRPRKDLVETLLHEMIHAHLFVTERNRDRDGHGPQFQAHMRRINLEAGTSITIYHSFHDEVAAYKRHWWRCDGPCRERRPFYGWVKRAMNRPPGPADRWWPEHQASCGGRFLKVKEPDGFQAAAGRKRKQTAAVSSSSSSSGVDSRQADIRRFVQPKPPEDSTTTTAAAASVPADAKSKASVPADAQAEASATAAADADWRFPGQGRRLGDSAGVQCPVCCQLVPQADVNGHLDTCLTLSALADEQR